MDLSALERSINNLEKSLDSLEVWLAVATALVVLGLVLEYWHEIPESIRALKVAWSWKPVCIIVGGILITAGVSGELFIQSLASRKETALRNANDAISAILKKAASDASERAADADERAANANERAANLELAIEPRRLSLEQQREIGTACRKFSGHVVKPVIYVGDAEAIVLSEQIIAGLKSANLSLEPTGSIMSPGGLTSGIAISGPDSESGLVAALVGALSTKGKLTHVSRSDKPVFAIEPNIVVVLVGVKPFAILGPVQGSATSKK